MLCHYVCFFGWCYQFLWAISTKKKVVTFGHSKVLSVFLALDEPSPAWWSNIEGRVYAIALASITQHNWGVDCCECLLEHFERPRNVTAVLTLPWHRLEGGHFREGPVSTYWVEQGLVMKKINKLVAPRGVKGRSFPMGLLKIELKSTLAHEMGPSYTWSYNPYKWHYQWATGV